MLKKIIIFFSLFLLTSSAVEVGKISMLRGEVSISRGADVLDVKIGTSIEEKDVINTKGRTKVQVTFKDETVVTLGSNTKFEVEEYLFDEKKQKIKLNVQNGSFKVITGRISKLAPKNFALKTKTSVIGVRGTVFTGKIGLGKSSGESISCIRGSIVVSSLKTNQTKVIDKGNMVFIKGDGSMGKVQAISESNFSAVGHLEEEEESDEQTNSAVANTEDNENTNASQNDTKTETKSEVSTKVSNEETTNKVEKKTEGKNIKIKPDTNTLIPKDVVYDYKGKLEGTSDTVMKSSTHTTKVKETFDANMNMRVDFGNNEPLKVDILNQNSQIQSATVDGKIVNDMNLPPKKDISLEMKQTIDRENLKINGVYEGTSGGLNTKTTLDGKFKDVNASGITGTLKESTTGTTSKGVDISREINGNFDVKKQ